LTLKTDYEVMERLSKRDHRITLPLGSVKKKLRKCPTETFKDGESEKGKDHLPAPTLFRKGKRDPTAKHWEG